MAVEPIIQSIQKLDGLHKEVLKLAQMKTEFLKNNEMEKLQHLLAEERGKLKALGKAEKQRQAAVEDWKIKYASTVSNLTITDILENIQDESSRKRLESATIELTETITALKQCEKLNQMLIKQSMQFVELSLDMIKPSIQTINYGQHKTADQPVRSAFDSKA